MSQDCTSIGKAKSTYDSLNGFSGVSEGSDNVSSNIDMEIAPGKKKNWMFQTPYLFQNGVKFCYSYWPSTPHFQVNLIFF